MAVSKSSIDVLGYSSTPVTLHWTTCASGANNTYVDLNGYDASKLILLVMHTHTTAAGTTGGTIWLGASASASSGSCWANTYVGRGTAWSRQKCHMVFPTTALTEGVLPSCATASIGVAALGPFDATRFKDSNGYMKISKDKAATDAGDIYVCPILVP